MVNYRQATSPIRVNRRDEGEGVEVHTIEGHAAITDQWVTIYKGKHLIVREALRSGAFREALGENQDVRMLFNHNRNYLLARTVSNTLQLREDSKGLHVWAELLDTQWNRDRIILPAQRGDLNQMSLAFLPRPGGEIKTRRRDGDKTIYEYEVTSVNLYDVSVVTVPANPNARFNVRDKQSFEEWERIERERQEAEHQRRVFLFDSALRLAEVS